jgi:hypothetical protein
MPVILATWEAKMGEFPFKVSLGKQFLRSELQNKQSKMH